MGYSALVCLSVRYVDITYSVNVASMQSEPTAACFRFHQGRCTLSLRPVSKIVSVQYN